jgi:hypothetical protein
LPSPGAQELRGMMAENDPKKSVDVWLNHTFRPLLRGFEAKRSPKTETPRRAGASNSLIRLVILEARAGVEPTYTDLQSGA